MKDYYKILNLEEYKDKSEDELRKILESRKNIEYVSNKVLDEAFNETFNDYRVKSLHNAMNNVDYFLRILDEIGKESYDNELKKYEERMEKTKEKIEKSKKKVSVHGKIPKKAKVVIAGVLAGTVLITSATVYAIKHGGKKVDVEVDTNDVTISTTAESKIEGLYSFEYIIEEGDTIWNLSDRFNAVEITDQNGNRASEDINVGDIVYINTFHPQAFYNYLAEKEKDVYDVISYKVKKGDTIANIASYFNVSVDTLLDFNPEIGNIDQIYEGQIINIPTKEVKLEQNSSMKK